MESKLKEIIADMFSVAVDDIEPDSGVVKGDIPNWDSLGHLRLILKIEEMMNIKFTLQEMQGMHDFSTIASAICSKQA